MKPIIGEIFLVRVKNIFSQSVSCSHMLKKDNDYDDINDDVITQFSSLLSG